MMYNFGLVVIGAHFGVWLKDQINSVKNEKILLVEPVPYNYNRLKEDFKDFKIPEGIYLTSLNYDTGLKSSLGEKNTIIEALKGKDINNINNNKLISINSYDKLIKYRQFY